MIGKACQLQWKSINSTREYLKKLEDFKLRERLVDFSTMGLNSPPPSTLEEVFFINYMLYDTGPRTVAR